MSRIVSGQLRLLEESSIRNASHTGIGIGVGKLVSKVPHDGRQGQPNMYKDANQRGKGDGEKGEIEGGQDLKNGSTFVDAFAHFSVGFEAELESPEDLDQKRSRRTRGGRKIIIPARMGKKDESGTSLPNKKQQNPPKKTTKNLVKKQPKRKVVRKIETEKGEGPEHTLTKPNERDVYKECGLY